ncbi:hypothetical protein KSF_066940 [Reticulibacter mediterranei]|uniref:GAF domain-containing protein n=1 Tax=Reticulibacter mediterranei TaxID=2778369 RepID=A0A8J3IUW5_9CHLR|nr:GAF domain-containing protein [Reticulibacter mediterranei]GHO96646.1 hypothetical protein KSF_066940 [Reticulibacter mediterranei]
MESQLLHKISKLLDALEPISQGPGDLTSTLQHIAQTAQTFFRADSCIIFAINPITSRFITFINTVNSLQKDTISYQNSRSEEFAQEVLTQRVLLIENVELTPDHNNRFIKLEGIHSLGALALRMRHTHKPLGVLYLNFKQQQKFSAEDCELFQFFADQASNILQEAWLLRRYQEIARIGQEINQALTTVEILFQKLQRHVADILDIRYAFLLAVYQPQTNRLDLYLGEKGHSSIRADDPLVGACRYVIETQETLFIRELSKEAKTLPFQPIDIRNTEQLESLIFVPLILRGMSLGVLSIQHAQPNVYNQEDLFILQLLANDIALAIYNMRLYDSLSRLNETGQLLTQQLDSEQVLQATADKIRDVIKADFVILYPYDTTGKCPTK